MKIYWLLFLLFGLIAGSVFFLMYTTTQNDLLNYDYTVPFWEKSINKIGPKIAYEKFSQSISDFSAYDQHTAAHIFGQALYNTTGLDGLTVCDDKFSNGCFHAFSGMAITERGLDETVPLMVDICNKESTVPLAHSCLHGVGHGIQSYLGYSMNNLSEAIKICGEQTTGNITAGCWGGVFMEYNLRSLIGVDSERPLDSTTLYEPCTLMPDNIKASCMHWQPVWWEEALLNEMSTEDFFIKIGDYCAALPIGEVRNACFSGVGSIMPARIEDIFEESKMCRLIAPNVHDAISCWSFVVNKTPYSEKTDAAMQDFCNGLQDIEFEYCSKHKGSSADIFNEHGQAIFP